MQDRNRDLLEVLAFFNRVEANAANKEMPEEELLSQVANFSPNQLATVDELSDVYLLVHLSNYRLDPETYNFLGQELQTSFETNFPIKETGIVAIKYALKLRDEKIKLLSSKSDAGDLEE